MQNLILNLIFFITISAVTITLIVQAASYYNMQNKLIHQRADILNLSTADDLKAGRAVPELQAWFDGVTELYETIKTYNQHSDHWFYLYVALVYISFLLPTPFNNYCLISLMISSEIYFINNLVNAKKIYTKKQKVIEVLENTYHMTTTH